MPKKVIWRVSDQARDRAKALRQNATQAEQTMWALLRAHRMEGVSFRRQAPIGPFIVDFVSHKAMLVIEFDGGQHFEDDGARKDARRDAFLRGKGCRVLRFSNLDVMTNVEGVWGVITDEIARAPSLTLPRRRGRETDTADSEPSQ